MYIENYLVHLQEMVLEILLKGKIKKRQYPAMVYFYWCLVHFYEKKPDSYIRLDFKSCKKSVESYVLVFDKDDGGLEVSCLFLSFISLHQIPIYPSIYLHSRVRT